MFQLQKRLTRIGTLHPDDVPSYDDAGDGKALGSVKFSDADVEVDEHGVCDEKSAKGNRPVRAQFGRKKTHNEELCVTSCGVIIGRATFYGSEAPNGVRVSPYSSYLRSMYSRSSIEVLNDSFSDQEVTASSHMAR